MKTEQEIKQCYDTQELYAKANLLPSFQPNKGECYNCNKNVYQDYETRQGYSLARAASSLTTGCPHCNRSFCD